MKLRKNAKTIVNIIVEKYRGIFGEEGERHGRNFRNRWVMVPQGPENGWEGGERNHITERGVCVSLPLLDC